MRYLNRIVALLSGALLIIVAVRATEFTDTAWATQAALNDEITAGEIALFSLAWAWVTFRWIARPPGAIPWMLAGLIVGIASWELIWPYHIYQWVSSSSLLAFISGIAAAAAIMLRSKRITARAVPA